MTSGTLCSAATAAVVSTFDERAARRAAGRSGRVKAIERGVGTAYGPNDGRPGLLTVRRNRGEKARILHWRAGLPLDEDFDQPRSRGGDGVDVVGFGRDIDDILSRSVDGQRFNRQRLGVDVVIGRIAERSPLQDTERARFDIAG
jgi:hypothetical protein